jgi:hypothetical protein
VAEQAEPFVNASKEGARSRPCTGPKDIYFAAKPEETLPALCITGL